MGYCLALPVALFLYLVAGARVSVACCSGVERMLGARSSTAGEGAQLAGQAEQQESSGARTSSPMKDSMSVSEAIHRRRSVREFQDRPLPIAHLRRILVSGDGITQRRGGIDHRAAPSAGALYPLDVHVIVSRVDTLRPGLYRLRVADSSLGLVRPGDLSDSVHHAANEQEAVGSSPVTIILSARFERTTAKYGDRGYQYVYMEAGAVCENIYLQATALGLGTCAVGAFDDDSVNRLLGLDGKREAALLVMPVGYPAGM